MADIHRLKNGAKHHLQGGWVRDIGHLHNDGLCAIGIADELRLGLRRLLWLLSNKGGHARAVQGICWPAGITSRCLKRTGGHTPDET